VDRKKEKSAINLFKAASYKAEAIISTINSFCKTPEGFAPQPLLKVEKQLVLCYNAVLLRPSCKELFL
jgi:hypothetical protein